MKIKQLTFALSSITASVLLIGCNSGNSNSTPPANGNNLAFYTDSQATVPLHNLNLKTTINQLTKQAVYVKNNGNYAVTVPQSLLGKNIDGLTLTNNSCTNTLSANSVCSFTVEFKPRVVINDTATLSYAQTNSSQKAGLSANNNALSIKVSTQDAATNRYMIEYWCGFSGSFCGQSSTDDVNPAATHVIMAFANVESNGSMYVDTESWPTTLISGWQASGKKVLISVGGQNVSWTDVFSNPTTFAQSVASVINTYKIDGVDLDIENGTATPQQVSDTINILRQTIGESALITIAPQNVGVYQGVTTIPAVNVSQGVASWNFFVPVLESSINSINLVMQQDYNNWYGGDNSVYNASAISIGYIENSYLNWVNSPLTIFPASWDTPQLSGFSGVPNSKLIIGVPAAESAATAGFYPDPAMVIGAYQGLESAPYNQQVAGFMMWDSYWDTQNSNLLSNTIATMLGLN